MSMLGKISTTMRRADRTPINMMSRPAMAMVYGRRNARRTNPIIADHPHSEPCDFFVLSLRLLGLLHGVRESPAVLSLFLLVTKSSTEPPAEFKRDFNRTPAIPGWSGLPKSMGA